MEVFFDRKNGYAFIDTKNGHGIVIGTIEEVEWSTEQEVAEMVMQAVATHDYNQIGSGRGRTIH